MVSADHPLIGEYRAGNFRDHVIDRLDGPIRYHFQVNSRGARPDVISDAQTAAPAFGSNTSGQRSKQRLPIAIGDWKNGNFRNRQRIFAAQALGVFGGADNQRERMSRINGHITSAAPLTASLVVQRSI